MSYALSSSDKSGVSARAILRGGSIDLLALGSLQRAGGTSPVLELQGGGLAVLFRYGCVLLFDASPQETKEFLSHVASCVRQPHREDEREIETFRICIDSRSKETVEADGVVLNEFSSEECRLGALRSERIPAIRPH